MCRVHTRLSATDRKLLTKDGLSTEEQQAFQWLLNAYRNALGPLEDDITAWVNGASEDDLRSLASIRAELSSRIGEYQGEFETVFREGAERGAQAGRAVAARQQNLSVDFDIVPERTLSAIDEWVGEAADSTLETITEDSARYLRGATREGLSTDEIADVLNEELYDNRLEDHVAERAARTATNSSANTGAHSAIEDSGAVAEQWLAAGDSRVRDDHSDADGQVVAIDNSFEVGGSYLAHPGDSSAPIGQIVNCRCSVVALFEDEIDAGNLQRILDGERLWLNL